MFTHALKYLLLVLLIASVCMADDDDSQEVARKKGIRYKPYKHKHHLLHHGGMLYYLAFLAIKVKIVFLIGTMITFALFAGKLFALFRYGSHFQKSEPEKIYIQSDPHPTYYSAPEYSESPHAHSSGSGSTYDSSSYGRSLGDSIFENMDVFKDIIKRLDLTEFAFESMEMDKDSCRKRFVCEADFKSKNSTILALGMYMFSDTGLNKYRTNPPVVDFKDCGTLYPDCKIDPDTIPST